MNPRFLRWIRLCSVIISLVPASQLRVCASEPQRETRNTLRMTPAPVRSANVQKQFWTRAVHWQDRAYTPSDAIPVLMEVALDSNAGPIARKEALDVLDKLANQLGGSRWVPNLIILYDGADEVDKKASVLTLLLKSEDARALPLFSRVLAKESHEFTRLLAAYGLAHWNVRQGVAEMIRLFDSRKSLPGGQPLANEALKAFQGLNEMKGWEWTDKEVRKLIESRSELDEDEKRELFAAGVKHWFQENKNRFPDWGPDDPLPKVPASDKNESSGE